MSQITLDATVGSLVAERPSRARVFERFGIDFCCGGKKPLADACRDRGVDAAAVRDALRAADDAAAEPATDWRHEPMTRLIGHIVSTHHAYLREELPRLAAMLDKVATVHGQRHPEMLQCRSIFEAFEAELRSHMFKEEQILFPMIAAMEAGDLQAASHCGSIANPIHQMEAEHDEAGDALGRMRELTNGYTPPADGCNTFRVLLDGLAQLERDMHQHVHKEDHVLFPRAAKLEAERAAAVHV